jgi:hypothetical protein
MISELGLEKILLFLFVFVIIFVVEKINYYNMLNFNLVPFIPGILNHSPNNTLALNNKEKKRKK